MTPLDPSAAGDTVRRWNRGVSLRALAVLPRKLAAWLERRRQRRMVERLRAKVAAAQSKCPHLTQASGGHVLGFGGTSRPHGTTCCDCGADLTPISEPHQ